MSYEKIVGPKVLAASLIGMIVVVIFFATYSFSLPFEFGVVASIFTFIYGFFLSTIFGFLRDKYLRFKELMAKINSEMLCLCNLAALFKNKPAGRKIRSVLIKLAQSYVDLPVDRYWKNQKYISELYSLIGPLEPKGNSQNNIHDDLLGKLVDLASSREKIETFGFHYLVGQMKWIYIAFTSILNIIILLISASNPYLLAIGAALVLILSFIS
jgi:hypothetical protein